MDFVVGHPRSGTRFVRELLCAGAPGVAEHELLTTLEPHAVAICQQYDLGKLGSAEVRSLVRNYRGRSERIDCNWKLTWILGPLLEEYPDARIIHLTRDPRDNIRSCYNLDYYGRLIHDPRYQTDEVRNRWLASLPFREEWGALSQLEKNCAFWSETHLQAMKTERVGRTLRVRLEDLLADDSAVRAVCAFLRVPPPSSAALARLRATPVNTKDEEKREVATLRGEVLPGFAEWTFEEKAALQRFCGELAGQLGYTL